MSDHVEDVLGELAGLAADLGPVLASAGHTELLQSITHAVRDLFAAAACSLALVGQEGERLEFVAAAGAGAELVVGMRIPAGRGIAGWVLASGPAGRVQRRRPRPALGPRDVAERTAYLRRSILETPVEGSQQTLGYWRCLTVMVRAASTPTKVGCWPCCPAGGPGGRAGTRVRRPG